MASPANPATTGWRSASRTTGACSRVTSVLPRPRTGRQCCVPAAPGCSGSGLIWARAAVPPAREPLAYNFCMQRKAYGRDAGLSARMLLTTFLLGLLYVVFAVVLFNVLSVGLVPMLLIVVGLAFFQYFTSDKIALRASGAWIVERDEAPQLHDMIERLCVMADLPKPRVAIIDTDVPNAFATGRTPKHAAVP